MIEVKLSKDEQKYDRWARACVMRRKQFGLDVPSTELELYKIDCSDEACFVACPNW